MKEADLRMKVVSTIIGWIGHKEGSAGHKEIIDTYNSQKVLPRGHKMSLTEPWCAATVSAAIIAAGLEDYIPSECSCNELIKAAMAEEIWVEDDTHIPSVGDIVMYDWQDDGAGDNTGKADHTGIVVGVYDAQFDVCEGNANNKVGIRGLDYNSKYIRGFICPRYDLIAKQISLNEMTEGERWAVENGIIAGYGNGEYGWGDPLTRGMAATLLMKYDKWRKEMR